MTFARKREPQPGQLATRLAPDREQIQTFFETLFRYATPGSYVSLRSFTDADKPFSITPVRLREGHDLVEEAYNEAARAANASQKIVFCPPVATFSGRDAKRVNVVDGVALSVELDAHPQAARRRLEQLLGPATVVVASGGVWLDPTTGQSEPKLHVHYRLSRPARGDERELLQKARRLATEIVGGDTSNIPISHPIRWPGSWHRKGEPKLCRIESLNADREIELADAFEILRKVKTERDSETEAFAAFGEENKPPIDVEKRLAEMRYQNKGDASVHRTQLAVTATLLNRGTPIDEVVERMLAATMTVPEAKSWNSEKEEQKIRGMCVSWLAKHPELEVKADTNDEQEQIQPVDLWGKLNPPALPTGLLPAVIERFAVVQGEMMGADPAGLAVAALVVAGAAIPDCIQLEVKHHSQGWTEEARLWAALIGTPSTKKSPILRAAAKPLLAIDTRLYRSYTAATAHYNSLPKEERTAPPAQVRLRLEDTTPEAAQEVLKNSSDGVLCLQDELGGWFGQMDKYNGNRGASKDRGFWLQAWNGGEYAYNRVGRGSGLIENLSISILGGIQPDTIRRVAADTLDDGLLQRLLPVVLRPGTVGHDREIPPVVDDYKNLIERLHELKPPSIGVWNLSNRRINLQFADDAQVIRRHLEQKHLELMALEVVNKKLAAHIGKYDGYFARLCVVWHCIENSSSENLPRFITADTARWVAKFLHEFLLPHASAFYAGILDLADDHDRLSAVAGYILAHKLDRVTNISN
jgi:hypothetical protein